VTYCGATLQPPFRKGLQSNILQGRWWLSNSATSLTDCVHCGLLLNFQMLLEEFHGDV